MKTNIYRNIELVRIAVKSGVAEYNLPQNVAWANKKVDKIVACVPSLACVDPVDGVTPVLSASDMTDIYFDIVSSEQKELLHAVSIEQLLHTNNYPIELHSQLDLAMCRLYFTTAPVKDMTLLLYVYYGGKETENVELPKNSVTVAFPLEADEEVSFRDIINYYIHALPSRVKGMQVWSAESAPAWIMLRDHDLTYQLANVHGELARSGMNGGSADDSQVNVLWLDNLDVDFDYSKIRNATSNANAQKITFLY